MELLKKERAEVTGVTYKIQDHFGVVTYKEWLQNGKCVDSVLRDKDGYEINDPDLLEVILIYLESIGELEDLGNEF
jgi:hypothetical protein